MSILHFLNVNNGDCSIIEHNSGRVSVLDVCNAEALVEAAVSNALLERYAAEKAAAAPRGNYGQKNYPVNPIEYMEDRGINSVFRFMLSHPDMDHLDGIKAFFDRFSPANFWDTDNTCAKDDFGYGRYQRADWDFYKTMRDGKTKACKRLTLYSGATGQFWNRNADGSAGADGLYVLAPTPELVAQANKSNDFNDCSYVILYRTGNRKILFSGDSHDGTWEHVLAAHEDDVRNVDLLIAPHHGRASDRSYEFLDTVNPRQTYFGNAPYEHLAYDAWNNRDLPFITNNQANCMVVETDSNSMSQYITNKTFAEASYPETFYSERHMAYYIGDI